MRKNNIKKIWRDGGAAVNGWLAIPSSVSAETMAHEAWDSLTIDLQHGLNDYSTSLSMLQAISTTNTTPFARVPWNEPGIIMKMLDAGTYGIICPMINSKEECEKFVGACRYTPEGYRSFGPVRANIYGGSDYSNHANEEIITMAMIETKQAVENLDSIYIGPADLSMSYTHKPSFDIVDPPVNNVIESILSKAKKHNVVAGIHTGSTAYAHKMIQLGFQFVTILSESKILSAAVEEILKDMKKDQSKKDSKIKTTY
jgi:4-hydroxy-2-oxoheptanedioate aldolase